jgi:hypothetical protein
VQILSANREEVLTMSELKKALVELVYGYLGGAASAGPAELLSR